MSKRPPGSGSISEKNGAYYGQWWVNGRRMKRSLGPVRKPHTKEGLTRAMAEERLRKLIAERTPVVPLAERYTIADVGAKHIAALRIKGRRENTLQDYESYLRVHLIPHFQSQPIAQISVEDVEALVAAVLEAGRSPKSVRNYLGFLHGIFEYALRKDWVLSNPCKLVDKPSDPDASPEMQFLDGSEIEALLRAVPDDELGQMEAVLYRTAAMSGLRQGELLALRWGDVDWVAQRIRVHRSRSRGRLGPTKTQRSWRSVPLADELAGDLDRHYKRTAFTDEEDLVFAHPHTGGPYDRSRLRKRFVEAIDRAGVRRVRFHDLRHTFGTSMAAAGVVQVSLQEWMGHRDAKTTKRYTHYAPSQNELDLVNAAWLRWRSQGATEGATLRITQSNLENSD